ncbi:MAG: YIP1 family protein [Clostridiaceae bacterium]|nr:YIP1 family protein [Clostridiaceae bacterium]
MSDIQVRNVNREMAAPRPGFFRRLIWLFISPGRLMEELAEKPRVLFWMIFGSVAAILPFITRMPLYEEMLRRSIIASSEYMESFGIEMTPEMIEAGLPGAAVTGLAGAFIEAAARYALWALLFFILMRIMGGEGRFKAYLSVVVHAGIIPVLYNLMLIPVSMYSGSLHQTAALTSLASLASPEEMSPHLYGLLAGIDVFAIWRFAVMAIGFTTVSKLKKKQVYIATAVILIIHVAMIVYNMPMRLQLM